MSSPTGSRPRLPSNTCTWLPSDSQAARAISASSRLASAPTDGPDPKLHGGQRRAFIAYVLGTIRPPSRSASRAAATASAGSLVAPRGKSSRRPVSTSSDARTEAASAARS
jgi:hypothetical protein